LDRCFAAVVDMGERLYPYVVFLPVKRKQSVLRAIFGSRVPLDILQFSIDRGISERIYQRELVGRLPYSNKTVLGHLKALTGLGVLEEHVEKAESGGRTVWVKYYLLSDLGRWFALLLSEEDALSREEKADILRSVFRSYVQWVRRLSGELGVETAALRDIFSEEMGGA